MKTITVKEYDMIVAERHGSNPILPSQKIKVIPAKAFEALKSALLQSIGTNAEMQDFMQLSSRKGIGEVLTVKNYVGLIATKDGTILEIQPKITDDQNQDEVRELLVKMVKTLRNDIPFKHIQTAHLNTAKMPLLEVFIRMFIIETSVLVKHGLKGGYQTIRQNGYTFKGKMRVQDHIRTNYAHKERCFIEYDSFELNRAENRIIKSTLLFLNRLTSDLRNKTDLNKLLFIFADIEASDNLDADLQAVSIQRDMKEYETILRWCRLFLKKGSFTPFSGDSIAFALLFPMESLFESYIASLCRKYIMDKQLDYTLHIQDRQYTLFDEPKAFCIRPDLVLSKPDTPPIVMDTKWKMLNTGAAYYGISQADMYQMYVYHKKYKAKMVVVIYPKPVPDFEQVIMRTDNTENQVTVVIKCIDILKEPELAVNHLLDHVLSAEHPLQA